MEWEVGTLVVVRHSTLFSRDGGGAMGAVGGLVASVLVTWAYVATVLRPVAQLAMTWRGMLAFGIIIDRTGNWHLPVVGSVGLLLAGAVLAFTMHPEKAFEEAKLEVR